MSDSNKFRPQDDLYEYVNHDDLASKEIPSDLPTIGGFRDLANKVEEILMDDFDNFSKGIMSSDCKYINFAINIYNMIINNNKTPIDVSNYLDSYISEIEKIDTIEKFNQNFDYLYSNFISLPFRFGVDVDMKSTREHALIILGPSTILPDTTYYENLESKKPLLDVWTNMAKQVLSYFIKSESKVDQFVNEALAFDELISKRVKSQVEWADYTKNYNPISFDEVKQYLNPVAFEQIVKNIYIKSPSKVIAYDIRFVKEFNILFNSQTVRLYKSWALVNFILWSSRYLCEELRILNGVYDRALTGIKEAFKTKKYAFKLVANELLSEPIGIYYGKKYFGEKAKLDVINMVDGLVQSYKERLSNNNWLSDETKKKAIVKLDKMKVKIGYPDKLSESYERLRLELKSNLYETIKTIKLDKLNYENSLLYKFVDNSVWLMPGHLVNACYNPTANDITFPAAVLQKPFYSIDQSREENFGGIGTVIGHEISHAFDNNGAQCDENGNLNNWWTESDYEKFKIKTKEMIEQFDGLPLGDGKVNGELVVSENIADLGGMASSLQTMERENKTDYEKFFFNYARVWAQKARKEYQELLLKIDVHAPTYWRANMQPRNFAKWYSTFNVTSSDKMYLPENKRIVIW